MSPLLVSILVVVAVAGAGIGIYRINHSTLHCAGCGDATEPDRIDEDGYCPRCRHLTTLFRNPPQKRRT